MNKTVFIMSIFGMVYAIVILGILNFSTILINEFLMGNIGGFVLCAMLSFLWGDKQ